MRKSGVALVKILVKILRSAKTKNSFFSLLQKIIRFFITDTAILNMFPEINYIIIIIGIKLPLRIKHKANESYSCPILFNQ